MAKGNFIEYVVSNNPNKYPNGGEQGGYYYELYDGSGQYAWKKYAKDQISFEWVEQDSVTREYIYNVSADNIDTTKITAEYFVGASGNLGASGNYVFQSSDTFYSNLTTCSFVYDSFNSQIRFDESFGNAWNIFPCDINYFISYVVTNNSNTYPDGEIQDGYWYEKVVEGVAGIDFGEVALASTAESVTVSHNLGTVPSWVALIPKALSESTDYNSYFCFSGKTAIKTRKSGTYFAMETSENTLTTNEITFNGSSSFPWYATDYYWVAIA